MCLSETNFLAKKLIRKNLNKIIVAVIFVFCQLQETCKCGFSKALTYKVMSALAADFFCSFLFCSFYFSEPGFVHIITG